MNAITAKVLLAAFLVGAWDHRSPRWLSSHYDARDGVRFRARRGKLKGWQKQLREQK